MCYGLAGGPLWSWVSDQWGSLPACAMDWSRGVPVSRTVVGRRMTSGSGSIGVERASSSSGEGCRPGHVSVVHLVVHSSIDQSGP